MAAPGRFQVAAGAIIEHRATGKILLIYRAPTEYAGDTWEFPVGRINQFETYAEGLRREVAEETGISDLEILRPTSTFEFMRGEDAAENEVRAVVFATKTDQLEVNLSHEHTEHKWVSIEEALELVTKPGIKADIMAYRDNYLLKP